MTHFLSRIFSPSLLRFAAGCAAFALILLLGACGSQKATVKSPDQSSATTLSGGGATLSSAADMRVQLRKIVASYGSDSWERLRIPVNINVQSPKQLSVSATAVMERGKSLLLSLQVLGFEVGSLYLTDRTIRVIDKMHKVYIEESIADFCAGFPVTVSNVQDILLGRLFIAGQPTLSLDTMLGYEAEIIGPQDWLLDPPAPMPGVDYGFRFSPADVLMALIVKAGDHEPVTAAYGRPAATPFGPFATSVSFTASTPKANIGASLEWNFDKARWDKDVELREPSVSSGYKRVSAADVTKMISGI